VALLLRLQDHCAKSIRILRIHIRARGFRIYAGYARLPQTSGSRNPIVWRVFFLQELPHIPAYPS
jgi:hypothetical protein